MQNGQKLWNDYVTLDAYFRLLDSNPELFEQASQRVLENTGDNTLEFKNAFPAIARRTGLAIDVVDEISKRFDEQGRHFKNSKELYEWIYPGGKRYSDKNSIIPASKVTALRRGYTIEFVAQDWQQGNAIGFYPAAIGSWTPPDNLNANSITAAVKSKMPGQNLDAQAYSILRGIPAYTTFQSDTRHKAEVLAQNDIEATEENVNAYQQAVSDHEWRHAIDHLIKASYPKSTTVETQAELYWHPYPLMHYTISSKLGRDLQDHKEILGSTQKLQEAFDKKSIRHPDGSRVRVGVKMQQKKLEALTRVADMTEEICMTLPGHIQSPLSYLFSTTEVTELPERIETIQPYMESSQQSRPSEIIVL